MLLLALLPGCISNEEKVAEKHEQKIEVPVKEENLLYDLDESASIIFELLKKDELATVLAESEQDKEKIDTLINNFSPSEMAFEAEVLNYKDPVVLLFYNPNDSTTSALEAKLKELAKKYHDKFKFVKINSEKLFKLAQQAEIDVFPTIMIMHNRKEVSRIEKPDVVTVEMLITEK